MSDKSQSKMEVKLGDLSFSGEGEQSWLAEQLQKVIDAASSVNKGIISAQTGLQRVGSTTGGGAANIALATYIKMKNAEKNQLLRFLVTADWLRQRGETPTSKAVAKALADNHQSRLANPADCLNKNISKGYCVKNQDGSFYITPEGNKLLGVDNASSG